MATPKRKVKTSATKRLKITLEKTVTLRLTSEVEVEAEQIDGPTTQAERDRSSGRILKAIKDRMAKEAGEDIERQWLTEKVDANDAFSIDWSSIQEVDPHITVHENTGK